MEQRKDGNPAPGQPGDDNFARPPGGPGAFENVFDPSNRGGVGHAHAHAYGGIPGGIPGGDPNVNQGHQMPPQADPNDPSRIIGYGDQSGAGAGAYGRGMPGMGGGPGGPPGTGMGGVGVPGHEPSPYPPAYGHQQHHAFGAPATGPGGVGGVGGHPVTGPGPGPAQGGGQGQGQGRGGQPVDYGRYASPGSLPQGGTHTPGRDAHSHLEQQAQAQAAALARGIGVGAGEAAGPGPGPGALSHQESPAGPGGVPGGVPGGGGYGSRQDQHQVGVQGSVNMPQHPGGPGPGGGWQPPQSAHAQHPQHYGMPSQQPQPPGVGAGVGVGAGAGAGVGAFGSRRSYSLKRSSGSRRFSSKSNGNDNDNGVDNDNDSRKMDMAQTPLEEGMTKDALAITNAAIQAVNPTTAIQSHLSYSPESNTLQLLDRSRSETETETSTISHNMNNFKKIYIASFGKAATAIALATSQIVAPYNLPTKGMIITKVDHATPQSSKW
mmetsp:Transcript_13078/g.19570  ORF Transcript_13078/g.19570 Transcript_13078/m.19570 type:complete len:492 (+) Transcript_13078:819-2294(+)